MIRNELGFTCKLKITSSTPKKKIKKNKELQQLKPLIQSINTKITSNKSEVLCWDTTSQQGSTFLFVRETKS